MTPPKDSPQAKLRAKDIVPVAQTKTNAKETISIEIKGKGEIEADVEIKGESTDKKDKEKIKRKKILCKAIVERGWRTVKSILTEDKNLTTEPIDSDGNMVLHIAVGTSRNFSVSKILSLINHEKLLDMKNSQGSTALHVAAIVGNTEAAKLLINRNKSLLNIQDHKGDTPLDKAYENMHLDTIVCLLKATNDDGKTKNLSPPVDRGVNVLANAISAKKYDLATWLIKNFPNFVVENDNVLMTIARTFPDALDYGETLIYPIMGDISEKIVTRTRDSIISICGYLPNATAGNGKAGIAYNMFFEIPREVFLCIYGLIRVLVLVLYLPFFTFYFLLWKVASRVAPIKLIEKKRKEWEEAKEVLKLVCDEIDKSEFPNYYHESILEAARQNAYEVVDEILMRSPEAFRYKDNSGYDIIQLAVINRSEGIYNLIYSIGERKNVYRTIEDSCKNNMLHLAGRLAPPHTLKRRIGAGFQLQRELEWREEVEKIVFPTYITKENIFKETPDMVFTREHENLVKEAEKWIKVVAESCSITAALIITITFAAAITVPGGSNQETGIPLFTKDIAFVIFAISDAVSLYASCTSILMFVSILTARCAEQDFLVRLPRRLIIGLCTISLAGAGMMVAFGMILFLVFCGREPWMLAPICVSTFLPLVAFGFHGMPLIVDLFHSTCICIFHLWQAKQQ